MAMWVKCKFTIPVNALKLKITVKKVCKNILSEPFKVFRKKVSIDIFLRSYYITNEVEYY